MDARRAYMSEFWGINSFYDLTLIAFAINCAYSYDKMRRLRTDLQPENWLAKQLRHKEGKFSVFYGSTRMAFQ